MKLRHFNRFCFNRRNIRNEIINLTQITTNHLTPELKLRLITPESPLWTSKPDDCSFSDPFWAFYWAGGQALTRYILDHPTKFCGRYILDVGSGCGASAIAAAKCNARACFANDIDNVACEAISINAKLNNCKVHIIQADLLNVDLPVKFDYIFIGDMFYDPNFTSVLFPWIETSKAKGAEVLIGDPGRYALIENYKTRLKLLKDYDLLSQNALETNGFKSSGVWKL